MALTQSRAGKKATTPFATVTEERTTTGTVLYSTNDIHRPDPSHKKKSCATQQHLEWVIDEAPSHQSMCYPQNLLTMLTIKASLLHPFLHRAPLRTTLQSTRRDTSHFLTRSKLELFYRALTSLQKNVKRHGSVRATLKPSRVHAQNKFARSIKAKT